MPYELLLPCVGWLMRPRLKAKACLQPADLRSLAVILDRQAASRRPRRDDQLIDLGKQRLGVPMLCALEEPRYA